jgi:hypothetical protein
MPPAFPKNRLFLCFSVVCWLVTAAAVAQSRLLTWPDHPGGRLYRIDVQRWVLEAETLPEVWQTLGPVNRVGVDAGDFPGDVKVVALPDKGTARYLLVDCTQQVYRFDFATRTLTRLDRTFYRGYNCDATRFVRRDTLYCFGGYGFWRTHNAMTYYKAGSREWESLNPRTNAPPSLHRGFNGYLPAQDRYLSTLNAYVNDSENRGIHHYDFNVYAYSFGEHRWHTLGRITAGLRERLNFDLYHQSQAFWTGRYFILQHYARPRQVLYLVDPVRNEVRRWEDREKLLTNFAIENRPNFAWNDTLVIARLPEGARDPGFQRLRLPVAKLWREAQPLGAFYEPIGPPEPSPRSWWLGGVALAALLGTGGWALWRARRRKLAPPEPKPAADAGILENLTDLERAVFVALLEARDAGGLTGERLHEILGVADKMPENQRRIRHQTLKSLNTKLKFLLGVDEAVQRIPTSIDRRMYIYQLKPEVTGR